MNEWTRLLLYGTYDGFSRSTEGENNINLILDNGDRVEVPNHFVKNASDFVERNKIKLKDIIARMEGLNGLTRIEWLDDILYKFGSNYGASKYKSGYEQGKLEGEWVGQQLKNADKIRQELNKPVVQQFVADWYEENKDDFEGNLFRFINRLPAMYQDGEFSEFENWVLEAHTKPFQTLVNMHQFGYTVEKEKRYRVKIIGIKDYYSYLNYRKEEKGWTVESKMEVDTIRTSHTRKELEQAGFGWVFDCPGVEIEEVEE